MIAFTLSALESLAKCDLPAARLLAKKARMKPLAFLAQAECQARESVSARERRTGDGMAAIRSAIAGLHLAEALEQADLSATVPVRNVYRVVLSWPGREWSGFILAFGIDSAIREAKTRAKAPDNATSETQRVEEDAR